MRRPHSRRKVDSNAYGWEDAITRSSMYSELADGAAQLAETYNNLASDRPLDARTRRLVRLAVAAALASEGGVRHHVGKALHEGLPADELRHTVTLALTMDGRSTIRALTWTEEAIARNGKGPSPESRFA